MYTQVAANKRKTYYLMFAFVVLITGLGWVLALIQETPVITIFVLAFAITYAIISYFAATKMALALTGAKEITKRDAPKLYRTVENTAIAAGLPTPKVYIVQDAAPNAFATGRDPNHAVVGFTTGILDVLDDQELEGVIAHELAHIGNYDIRVMSIVVMLFTVVAMISDILMRMTFWGGRGRSSGGKAVVLGIVAAILAYFIALLLKMAVSRRREYLADASGALLTRYPEGLARALKKIETSPRQMEHANSATAHLFIANPLTHKRATQSLAKLFSTHPPVEKRIERLQKMETSL